MFGPGLVQAFPGFSGQANTCGYSVSVYLCISLSVYQCVISVVSVQQCGIGVSLYWCIGVVYWCIGVSVYQCISVIDHSAFTTVTTVTVIVL